VSKRIPVTLVDQFGTTTGTVVSARRLCNPADKNGEDPSAPTSPGHYVGYTVRRTSGVFTPVRGQQVTNQFGTFVLTVLSPVRLFVPTSKSLTSPPPPPDPGFDHFQCYKATGGASGVRSVAVQDEFGTGQVRLMKPVQLCVPVDKNGSGIPNPAAKLLCYRSRLLSGTLHGPKSPVFVNNQFGADTFNVVLGADQFCVPSSPSGAFLDGGSVD